MCREKAYEKNRVKNESISFHVTPEEHEAIDRNVRLSGLKKQDYITQRCLQQDIVVYGNPRVYRALKSQIESILVELQRLSDGSELSHSLADTIRLVSLTLYGLERSPGSPTVCTPVLSEGPNEEKGGSENV